MGKKEHNNCLVCGASMNKKSKINSYLLFECPDCQFQSFFPRPLSTRKYYETKEYFQDGQKFIKTAGDVHQDSLQSFPQYKTCQQRILKILRRVAHEKPLKLLDVGCGSGLFVTLCNKQDQISAMGIDISRQGIALTRHLNQSCYVQGFIKDMSNQSFDIITMFDVLEHVPNPLKFIKKARRVLTKNGLLVITTPISNSLACKLSGKKWHLYTPPRHLQIFNTKSIRQLLENNGFQVTRVQKTGQYTNLGYIIEKMSSLHNINLQKFLFRFKIINKINLYLNLYDVATVWAIKK
jgi:2-polyprenyl-3-methyl-5-hydroxy-6-metoxy-1,4-benzoquinol methylase